ncbi:regulatory signaling modulator protein AmpE [Luteimonas suaedae]|uniref:regulatory signaling modulator protein AmpE n=1 Tax=Luteimonas suaedae TaxID=2605430 RepID=UPI0011EF5B2F|nr:regulatory signaling modulator protein AmpE [Luteimonas suaedae]
MFATLLAVVVALVLGHVAPALAGSLRQYGWYQGWLRWLDGQFPQEGVWQGRFGIALALLPPLLLVALFQFALDERMLGFPALLFGVAVLFYAWGPRDLDLDVQAVADAADPVARRAAAARLWPHAAAPSLTGPDLVARVFRNARGRWFGVLFWFLLLGPFGALLYRLTALAAEGEASAALPARTAAGARGLLALLDWPVTQLLAVSLALVGNFDVVVGAWREAGSDAFGLDSGFLDRLARASVREELADEAADYVDAGLPPPVAAAPELPELRDAMSLVWRILLLWLAVIALFVIAGWVG